MVPTNDGEGRFYAFGRVFSGTIATGAAGGGISADLVKMNMLLGVFMVGDPDLFGDRKKTR